MTIDGDRLSVRAFGELVNGELVDIPRRGPQDEFIVGSMDVTL